MLSIKTNIEFPRGDDPIKQGQRLAQDLSSNFKGIVDQFNKIPAAKLTGRAVLVAGIVVVNCSSITNESIVLITSQVDGGTVGFLRISARTEGISFTITSSNAADTSTIGWVLF